MAQAEQHRLPKQLPQSQLTQLLLTQLLLTQLLLTQSLLVQLLQVAIRILTQQQPPKKMQFQTHVLMVMAYMPMLQADAKITFTVFSQV